MILSLKGHAVAGQGKQAKIITLGQEKAILRYLGKQRYPDRGRVMFLLSLKAGLRAIEIASLTWEMITDSEGMVGDSIELPNVASKGHNGGRSIPMHPELRTALEKLRISCEGHGPVVVSERGGKLLASSVVNWFEEMYDKTQIKGCSSHSGRRTFITRMAKLVGEAGGSLRDIQQLAGHSSLQTTQRYIEGDTDAKRKLVFMV